MTQHPIPAHYEPEYMANTVFQDLMDNEGMQEGAHLHACAALELNGYDVLIGGDVTDLAHNMREYGKWTLIESDARYDLYWAYYSAYFNKVLAHLNAQNQMHFAHNVLYTNPNQQETN